MLKFRHSGKLGDIIYSLPTVLRLGGGDFLVDVSRHFFNKSALIKDVAEIGQILEPQPYIRSVGYYDKQPIDVDLWTYSAIISTASWCPLDWKERGVN